MSTEVELSDEQQAVVLKIHFWYHHSAMTRLTFGGFAGTGKTTIIAYLVNVVFQSLDVAVCAYTGKAASVLRRKGIEEACTVHRLIYDPVKLCPACDLSKCSCGIPKHITFVRKLSLNVDLVIVDEASMISERLIADLESFGVKVLYVGDHGQLGPIGDHQINLMAVPQLRLETIHRQAADSYILKFAHSLRVGMPPDAWLGTETSDLAVRPKGLFDPSAYDVVLCGYNRTRQDLNRMVRQRLFHSSGRIPETGERVICIQNNSQFGVFNGQRFQVESVTFREYEPAGFEQIWLSLVDEGGEIFYVPVDPDQFGSLERPQFGSSQNICFFDWGYVLTAHRSQGSEWDRVAVVQEIASSWEAPRWRYTVATRAAKILHYFVG